MESFESFSQTLKKLRFFFMFFTFSLVGFRRFHVGNRRFFTPIARASNQNKMKRTQPAKFKCPNVQLLRIWHMYRVLFLSFFCRSESWSESLAARFYLSSRIQSKAAGKPRILKSAVIWSDLKVHRASRSHPEVRKHHTPAPPGINLLQIDRHKFRVVALWLCTQDYIFIMMRVDQGY